ncbi:MAG TPA: hypothetical protein VGA69_08120 [Nitriliruptorales bacterium]
MALFESLTALIGTKTAAAAAGLVLAGGAAAGAADHLPDQLQDAFDAVSGAAVQAEDVELPDEANGVELPDEANGGGAAVQGEGELPDDLPEQARAGDVHDAIDATDPGRERGEAVSEAASQDHAGGQGAEAAEAGADNADNSDNADVADDQPEEATSNVPDEGDEGAANADQRGDDRP